MAPNNSIFNNENGPLFVQSTTSITDATVIESQATAASKNGTFYAVSTGSQSIAPNNFLLLQLTVPINSGKTIYISRVSGGSIANTTIDLFFNATFAAAGTAVTPANFNAGSSNTSVVTAKFIATTPDPTTGGTRLASVIQTSGPIEVNYDGRFIVVATTTTRTFYVRLVNNSSQTNLLSVNVSYWELDS